MSRVGVRVYKLEAANNVNLSRVTENFFLHMRECPPTPTAVPCLARVSHGSRKLAHMALEELREIRRTAALRKAVADGVVRIVG